MSRRINPLDEAFRHKLEHYTSETPEHLWQGIARQRNMRRKVYLRWRERALLVAALILFVYASVLTWQVQQMKPALSSFPIALESSSLLNPDAAANTPPLPAASNALLNSNDTPIYTHFTDQQAVVNLLPEKNEEVESLTAKLAATFENFSGENSLSPAAAALSALQLSSMPLALYQVSRQRYPIYLDQSKCAAFTDKKVRLYFDLLASPDFAFRKIQPRTGDFEKYAETRKATEAARFNYSVGARLSAVTKGGMALRAGINYSEINERFELQNGTRIIIRYDQNGNFLDSVTVAEKIVTNNRYQTLDIPVMIGYEVNLKKVTLTVNGGAYFNIHFKPQGEFISPYDNRPVGFTNEETPENNLPAFRENLGIGWYSSLGVQYRISPRLQLLVEPHVKMYPRSYTRDDFMTEQKYLTAGVFVGLRHQFSL